MIDKLKLSAEEVHSWDEFWESCPKGTNVPVSLTSPFKLPKTQPYEQRARIPSHKRSISAIDDGNRHFDVVCHKNFDQKFVLQPSKKWKHYVKVILVIGTSRRGYL